MPSPPVPAAPSQLSAASGTAAIATAKQKEDVSELMAAIQSVLEEHNVVDARFILELPPSTATTADSAAMTTVDATARDIQRTGKASVVTASIDSSASNTGGGGTTATLLIRTQTAPAVGPTAPPEHHQPPPRARSPSAQTQAVAPQYPQLFPKHALTASSAPQSGTSPQNNSVSSLSVMTHPAVDAAAEDAGGKRTPPAAAAQAEPVNAIPAQPATQPGPPPSRCLDDTFTSKETAAALTDDTAAGIRLVSNQLAHVIAAAEVQMSRKEILQKFVGRSAILEDRRQREAKREAQMQSQTTKARLNGTPPPALPLKEDAGCAAKKPSPQPRRGTATTVDKYPARRSNTDAANPSGTAATTLSAAVSSPSPDQPQPYRRSVVRLTPPPPSASLSGGDSGARSSAWADSSSLPSLVSAKKSAVPGKTPVFSILNKEGSRLLDQGAAAVTPRSSLFGMVPAGGASAAASRAATNGGGPTEASWSSSNSNNTSVSPRRHSHPGGVSLRADDRAPPSPVHEPLLGTAAEEEANRQRSILVQTQPRSATQEPQTLESAGNRGSEGALPKLWSEQSKDNASRASQLQSQSRLSHTLPLNNLSLPCATVTTTVSGKHQTDTVSASSTVSSPRQQSRMPTSSAADASARSSLRTMLQEQQQLQEASRRSMEEHNRLMQATRAARMSAPTSCTPSNAFEASKAPVVALVASPEHAAAAVTGVAAAVPAVVEEGDRTQRRADIAASPAAHNTSVTPTCSTSGIQVVKFTLPHDQEARQAAVQQLCRSCAGTQHIDSKERYRALLAAQQEEFTAQEAKTQSYRALLSRAIEFNHYQQQQQQTPRSS
ncbi:hypothetical protein CUR178_05992 [Leishmania enriettii]|uniref:Uncharacterized protein n=1 Tax=Leishmania enriettii TaxID=5663 RepID=A0A836KTF8_LEIEN|nr:hypothetical protein CUR178_05992 [Leishmania enriettii]